VALSNLLAPPEVLQTLISDDTNEARHFRKNIRQYNSALSFTSLKYSLDNRAALLGPGIQCFQIHGELYHLQGPLEPQPGQQPKFAQLFLYDPRYAASIRHAEHPQLLETILERLTLMLHEINPFITLYKTARERLAEQENQGQDMRILLNPQLQLVLEVGADARRHNLPTGDEVAMIIPTEYGDSSFRDIVLATRTHNGGTGFTIINENHAGYMPLHYVLLFPRGELGWHWGLELRNPDGNRQKTRMPQRSFYRYRLHTRANETDLLFRCQRLFQQYLVDAWAACDQNKLSWLRSHQSNIRADVYNGLVDIVHCQDLDPGLVGRSVILPSSYTGGDRFMQQLFQDSMAIVRHFGRPTLFITFTANPKWEEITNELLPGQTSIDRPDLVARVFHLKQQQLLKDLKKKQVFGEFLGCVWTIEYQKRGLPHMHLLLFLNTDASFFTPENIDRIISAELPPPTSQKNMELAEIIKSITIHGPCGDQFPQSPCMKATTRNCSATCSKSFPKAFCEETKIQENGYPQYRRRDNGQSFQVPLRNGPPGATFTVDNRWVVPYNPYLSWKYKAHINVEVCASINAIKYIHKYIYKGSDQTTLQVDDPNHDEIKQYLQGRYIGPTEAIWRLFEFGTHEEWPPVTHLALHLPGEQPVYFEPEAGVLALEERMATSSSTLMAFFKYNAENEDGHQYLYQEFPTHFVYKSRTKEWKPRQKGIAIGRMYTCSPLAGERYYLRLLLTIIPGAQSFAHLRTIAGMEYQTFKEACRALGLLDDDGEWVTCFTEAATFATGHSLRILFSTALIYQEISDPAELWNQFKEYLCDDLQHQLEVRGLEGLEIPDDLQNLHLDYGLFLISEHLAAGRKTLEECGLPQPVVEWKVQVENPLIAEELSYNLQESAQDLQAMVGSLNLEQRNVYDTILNSMEDSLATQYFLQGPAGTGKTFLYRCICGTLRAQGKIVLCVASSGIAAQLLPGGLTSHSRFRIPLIIHEDSVCSISHGSDLAALLENTDLIIWDEVPMQHKHCFTAVDRVLNDICNAEEGHHFGNIPIILGGDFAQILPIVPNGNRGAIVNACIQQSILWPGFQQLRLSQNMRVASGSDNANFAAFLSSLSYSPEMYGVISLPPFIQRLHSLDTFCNHVFPPTLIHGAHLDFNSFKSRAILSFRNDTVMDFNNRLILQLQGDMHFFNAVNSVEDNESTPGVERLPMEFLQGVDHASLPPSKLCLKIGAPVILLRNLSPKQGLCNGTRITITQLGRSCIGGLISAPGSQFDGQFRLLPRIRLTTLEGDLPFILTRKQFPIRLCFAMTVNKSQGQSLTTVGIDLRTPAAFTHGQFYVAMSRVTSLSGLMVLFSEENTNGMTENVVYPEVLL